MKELDIAEKTALKAGKLLLKLFSKPKAVKIKTTETDLVTEADMQSQAFISEQLAEHFPKHNIISEENLHKDKASEYTWYIDPLDGTVNFAHDHPMFSVSIGLKKENTPLVGVVYVPLLDELFYAVKSKGVYLNRKPIQVSRTQQLLQSIVATGFPYHKHINPDNNVKEFCRVITKIQGFRRSGCASLDLCYVACGRLDGYWELFIKPWDYLAGALIVEEAGGMITNTEGLPLDYVGSRVVATNGKIHKALLEALKNG